MQTMEEICDVMLKHVAMLWRGMRARMSACDTTPTILLYCCTTILLYYCTACDTTHAWHDNACDVIAER